MRNIITQYKFYCLATCIIIMIIVSLNFIQLLSRQLLLGHSKSLSCFSSPSDFHPHQFFALPIALKVCNMVVSGPNRPLTCYCNLQIFGAVPCCFMVSLQHFQCLNYAVVYCLRLYRVLRPLASHQAVDMPVDLCIDTQDVMSQLINYNFRCRNGLIQSNIKHQYDIYCRQGNF